MNDTPFRYTYSAKEQDEIKAIRMKYTVPEEQGSKMEQLRRLDASASQKASMAALIIGILGALILGSGMSLIMTEIGELLALGEPAAMLLGIGLGLPGILLVSLAYPLYNRVLKRERERIAPEIIRLSDELMK